MPSAWWQSPAFRWHWCCGCWPAASRFLGTLAAGLDAAHAYLLLCICVLFVHLAAWTARRLTDGPDLVVAEHHVRSLDVAALVGRWPAAGLKARLLAHVPGNQLFQLDVDQEHVVVDRLPAQLAGLSILHLSDFHFSGRIELAYFHQVVRLANELAPDLSP